MPCVYSNAEQGNEVISSSSPVAVNRFAEERGSIRRTGKVSQSYHMTVTHRVHFTTTAGKYIYAICYESNM